MGVACQGSLVIASCLGVKKKLSFSSLFVDVCRISVGLEIHESICIYTSIALWVIFITTVSILKYKISKNV